MKPPPGTPRSRSLTRFTMRVDLPHLGQSVLLDVSITFLRSAVLAIFAIYSPKIYFTRGWRGCLSRSWYSSNFRGGDNMKARIFYRIAAVLLLLFTIGHTLRFRQSDPQWGVDALLASMKS